MKHYLIALLCGLVLLGANGCAPIDTDNAGTSQARLAIGVGEVTEALDSDGVAFRLNTVVVAIDKVVLDLPKGADCPSQSLNPNAVCLEDIKKVELEGPFLVDLIRGTWTPEIEPVALPSGAYETIEVAIKRAKSDWSGVSGPDDVIVGNSFLVEGVFSDGSTPVRPYRFVSDLETTLVFEPEAPVVVDSDTEVVLNLRLQATSWFSQSPLAACADAGELPLEDEVVLVVSGADAPCKDIDKTVEDAIKASTTWSTGSP